MMQDLIPRIVNYLTQSPGRSVRAAELASELGVKKKDFSRFKAALAQLLQDGQLTLGRHKQLSLAPREGLLTGLIRRTSYGSGRFRPHDPTLLNPDEWLYVAPEDLRDAYTGDEVQVQMLKRRRSKGQRCARVVKVLQRASMTFVGTYLEKRNHGFVRIDGGQFESAISVGDPGAKGARPDDQVVVEILRFPSANDPGEAVITRVLGPRGMPGVDLLTIIHEFGLPDDFPESVLAEARQQARQFESEVGAANPEGVSSEDSGAEHNNSRRAERRDLTSETIVTIDPVDARDFDDAISLTRDESGDWRLGVHIADVAHFVQPGSLLDKEARQRGTSVYLPDKVLPMLPEVISNALASLQQGRLRYTKSVFITFNSEGIPVHGELANSQICVTQRFAYEEVLPLITTGQTPQRMAASPVAPEVLELLQRMRKLAQLLRQRRFSRGALELDLPEVKVDMDADGKVTGAHLVPHDESHQIIEEFMLAANVAVATLLADRGVPFLRRTHAPPDDRKLRALSEFVGTLGHRVRSLPGRGDLQKLLEEVRGTSHEQAVSYAVLRSTRRAEYNPDPEVGHYALAEPNYCHFTSPIRRYPDLTIHRLVDGLIRAGHAGSVRADHTVEPKPIPAELVSLGKWCSVTERRADEAEDELVKLKLLEYLADRLGETLSAIITGVEKFGLFCQGVQLPAEGLVHVSTLSEDRYDYDDRSHTLVGRKRGRVFRLGDPVTVRVKEVDLVNRSLAFEIADDARQRPRNSEAEQGRAQKKDRSAKHSRRPKISKKASRKRR